MTEMRPRSSRIFREGSWGMIGFAVLLLALLHHDFWLWDDRRIVLGFLPIGLAYHVMYSIMAATLWAFAVRFAWPAGIERWADGDADVDAGGDVGGRADGSGGDG